MILKHMKILEKLLQAKDDYTAGCLLDYPYFKENYKMIATDLSKQQALDAYPGEIQQIGFTGNIDPAAGAFIFFHS